MPRFQNSLITIFLICANTLVAAEGKGKPKPALVPSPLVPIIKQLQGIAVQIDVVLPPDWTPMDAKPLGSGFWINDSGYVATCWHVVKDFPNGKWWVQAPVDSSFGPAGISEANWVSSPASVVATDELKDIAILKVERVPDFSRGGNETRTPFRGHAHFKVASFRDNLPDIGVSAIIIGYPLGEPYQVVQEGSIASLAFNLPGFGPTVKVLISTVANPGNSGGPVFDDSGTVLGLVEGQLASRAQPTSGITVVVPVQSLVDLAKQSHIELGMTKNVVHKIGVKKIG